MKHVEEYDEDDKQVAPQKQEPAKPPESPKSAGPVESVVSAESEKTSQDFSKELGLPAPHECKKCEDGKCDPQKVAHCCDHELDSFDEMRIFFFGVIFHELMHWAAAKLAGVRVIAYKLWHPKVAWVRVQNPKKAFNDTFISFAPLLFGSIVSSLILIWLFSSQMWYSDPLAFIVLLYLAVSIAVCSPISKVDAYSAALALGLSYLRRKKSKDVFANLIALLVWPFYALVVALFKLSRFWFNLVQYLFLAGVFAVLSALLFVH